MQGAFALGGFNEFFGNIKNQAEFACAKTARYSTANGIAQYHRRIAYTD